MGSYYELFLPEGQDHGGHTLATAMHGHYMPLGYIEHRDPFKVVMGSQAYTMYRTEDFLEVGGYFDECRFYPHPEGYMPLKIWMFGKEMWVHQDSWHIHGMFHRHYEQTEAVLLGERIRFIVNSSDMTYEQKLNEIRKLYSYEDVDEGVAKRAEYGGKSWHWHGVRNVFMIAYILGGEKWLDICCAQSAKRNGEKFVEDIRESAIETAFEERLKLLSNPNLMFETIDDILIYARRSSRLGQEEGHVWGMENWDKRIGEDPL
jgi:hypothetical protein